MPQQASVAFNQFPQVVWRDGEKKLWNPIHRQALKNRPEERVRLRVIEYLIRGGWSKHRISTEEKIGSAQMGERKRTDLICYTQAFAPHLLVECKAENIKLSEKTALQIAQYNRQIEAPFLLLTNGLLDFWYSIKDKDSLQPLVEVPEPLPQGKEAEISRDYNYWESHGFTGSKAPSPLRSWLKQTLNNNLISDSTPPARYLSFKQQPTDVDLNHYYQTYRVEKYQIALGFVATQYGGSRLIAILNINGENTAVLEINLDLLADEQTPNASVYWTGGTKNVDICSFTDQLLESPFNGQKTAADISSRLMRIVE